MKTIRISQDYSESLGARNITDGDYSGEDFRNKLLEPAFLEAQNTKQKILIDFDGGYGNPVSFVEEAFGGLARKYGSAAVESVFIFISNDEEGLVDEVIDYIRNPFENEVYKRSQARNRQKKNHRDEDVGDVNETNL